MMDDKLAFANERFGNDVFATQTTGIEIVAVDIHYAKCRLQVDGRHRNAMGAVMGGVIYTLADFAFAIAANMDKLDTVSLTSTVTFIGQPKGDTLFAEAKPVKDGASVCHYEINVTDNQENTVAHVNISGFKIKH